jgi:hypothetical protein
MKQLCKNFWSSAEEIINNKTKFIYTGGLNPVDIGKIVAHFEKLGYHFYEGDYRRYDGHTEEEAIEAELEWYQLPSEVKAHLRLQLKTKGGTGSGIKFGHNGKVASGVINTSLGNTIRGFMIIAGFCQMNAITDYFVMQLGDDNVLMFKEPIDLDALRDWAKKCGHDLDVVHRPDVDHLEYCSQRFWNIGNGERLLAFKIGRVMSKTFVSTDPTLQPDQLGFYVDQVAQGFKHHHWMPVFGTFLGSIRKAKFSGRPCKIVNNPYSARLGHEIEVDYDSVRTQFYKIYGFDPEQLEEDLRNWVPTLGTALHHPMLTHINVVDGVSPAVAF